MTAQIHSFSKLSTSKDGSDIVGAVLCFGHFNTIHPGHIRYFRRARKYSGPLVIALEGDLQLSQAGRSNFFSEHDRAQAVAALDMISHVVILDSGSLTEFVRKFRPTTLILGKEFERTRAGKVATAVAEVRSQGNEVFYDAGETNYASAALFHGSTGKLERERWHAFQSAQSAQKVFLPNVFSLLSEGEPPHILVIGDTIVDQYVACDPVGMSNEAPVVVVKEIEAQEFAGGASIVAAHVAALGARCTYISVTGTDVASNFVASKLTEFGVDAKLFEDPTRPTTYKIRYIVENQKLFRVSRLREHSIAIDIEDQFIKTIIDCAPRLDGILVSDFVYGVITDRIIDALMSLSSEYNIPIFGDLQCSSQVGNISKFQNFHLICPTEREARIALSNQDDGVEYVANLLRRKTRSSNMILKLGPEGFIAYAGDVNGETFQNQHFPALTVNPVDVTGAGDALLAAMAVALTKGLSMMEASALACCVSGVAVQVVGNHPVELEKVKEFYERGALNGVF